MKKIETIEITSFRSLRNVTIKNLKDINYVYGKNGSGKTSVIESVNWVLTGETLDYGEKDEGNIDVLNPYDMVDVKITLNDGQSLQRKYGNKLQDDGTTMLINYFYANERKCKNQKEYYEYVDNMFNLRAKTNQKINLRSCFVNPYKFSLGVDPKVLRKYIEELLNVDIDSQLFETGKYTKILNDYMKHLKIFSNLVDQYGKDVYAASKDIKVYDSLIEEMDYEEVDTEKLNNLLNEKEEVIKELKTFAYPKLEEATTKLRKVEQELSDSILQDKISSISPEETELTKEINQEKVEFNKNVDILQKKKNQKVELQHNIKMLKNKRESLELDISLIEKRTFSIITCPHCNKTVNEDDEQKFNEEKSKNLKAKYFEEENTVEKIVELTHTLEEVEKQYNDVEKYLIEKKKKLGEMEARKEMLRQNNSKSESTKTLDLRQEKESLEKEIEELRNASQKVQEEHIKQHYDKLNALEQQIAEIQTKVKQNTKLEEYKNKKREMQFKLEELYEKKEIANEFKRAKIKATKKMLQKIFGDAVDFEFIKESKTSDYFKEVCYATLKGISYNAMNTANKLRVGVLIINKMREFVGGCDLPVVFDVSDNIGKENLQSILDNAKNQVFYTKVDVDDKKEREIISYDRREEK